MQESRNSLVPKALISFLLCLFILPNLFLSGYLELAYDETYYWIYSQFLDFGYYDHPPMVGVSIYLGNLIFGHSEFATRLPFVLYLVGTMLILWSMVKNSTSSLLFLAMLFSMPLINLTGLAALPDGPLMFFSALFFKMVNKYLNEDNLKNVILLSVTIAAMFYSKYHGLLIVLLTVIAYPAFLKRKSFWGIVALVVILFMPHMYWQYTHDFVTFKFHLFKRTEKHFSLGNILNYVSSQVVLMGFLNFFLFVYIFYKNKFKDAFERILVFNSLGFLIFLLLMSFRNQIEANWTISCSLALTLLMLKYIKPYKKLFLAFAILNLFLGIGLKGTLFSAKEVAKLEIKDNRLNEMVGWVEERIPKILEVCNGTMIVGDNYQVTSKLAFYTKNPRIPALHLGSRESQYSILNFEESIPIDKEICYLTSKNLENSVKIETNYKDPVYIIKTRLGDLAQRYKTTYEEIIRN